MKRFDFRFTVLLGLIFAKDTATAGNCDNTPYVKTTCPTIPNRDKLCITDRVYYLFGGPPCYSDDSKGNCYATSRIVQPRALNLNGPQTESVNGIIYSPDDDPELWQDFDELREVGVIPDDQEVFDIINSEVDLYVEYVEAKANPTKGSDTCMKYNVGIARYGRYELRLRFLEPKETEVNQRRFTVRYNNYTILENFDIFSITNKTYGGLDLILPFEVTEWPGEFYKKMTLVGLQDPPVELPVRNSFTTLDLCYGDCDVPNNRFILFAFHVEKFEDDDERG